MTAAPAEVIQGAELPEEVIAATRRGWRLLPIRQRDKIPLVDKWPEKATSDRSQLAAWDNAFPGCNWAVATGKASGVFVLDVDGDAGINTLLNHYQNSSEDLPDTLTVNTGRGSHLYFRWPSDHKVSNSAGKLGVGLDIRGEGGYAVIPPSVHASGKPYAYVKLDTPITDAPAWILTAQDRPAPKLVTATSATAVPQGRRNDELTRMAGFMRGKGFSQDAIVAALLEENMERCSPPLPQSEVSDIARSVSRYAPGTGNGQTRSLKLRLLADVEAKAVDWLWKPYLPKGMLSLLSGDPGCGKTFLALAIAAALSNGTEPYSGLQRAPVSTLYLSIENSPEHTTKPRFVGLKGDSNLFFLADDSSLSLSDTEALARAIEESKAGLVVVDPLQSYLGASVDQYRSNETRPILDGLARIAAELRCCVLLVRHLAKGPGGRAIHKGLGSIDITGAARTELIAGTAASDPNHRALIQCKSNLGPYGATLGYSIDGEGFRWTGESQLTTSDLFAPEYAEEKTETESAIEFLTEALASGARVQTELVKESPVSERTLQRAAQRMKLAKSRAGEGGKWIWSLPGQPNSRAA